MPGKWNWIVGGITFACANVTREFFTLICATDDRLSAVAELARDDYGLKTTIKASDAKQQQIYSRLWCSKGFVNKTDDYSDESPLDEVSRSLHQSEFQPDVQVHVVVQHSANRENANENAEARTFRNARSTLMYHCESCGANQDRYES